MTPDEFFALILFTRDGSSVHCVEAEARLLIVTENCPGIFTEI